MRFPQALVAPSPRSPRIGPRLTPYRVVLGTLLGLTVVAVEPALAQSAGAAFCESMLADTIRNIFTVIQFGGPLIGGLLALAAIVLLPMARNVERKRELKEIRDQGIIWGVLVAPLGAFILQFILSYIVAGGTTCTF